MTDNSFKNKEIEEIYQRNRKEKSPQDLDNFILSQAKNSCRQDKAAAVSAQSKRRRWLYALPSAAVVLLGLTVTINLYRAHELNAISPLEEMLPKPTSMESDNEIQVEILSDIDTQRHSNLPQKRKAPKKLSQASLEASKETLNMNKIRTDLMAPSSPSLGGFEDVKDFLNEAPQGLTVRKEALEQEFSGPQIIEKPVATLEKLEANSINPKPLKINQLIEEFNNLISNQKPQEAESVLEFIAKNHPDYDLTELQKQLTQLNKTLRLD